MSNIKTMNFTIISHSENYKPILQYIVSRQLRITEELHVICDDKSISNTLIKLQLKPMKKYNNVLKKIANIMKMHIIQQFVLF